jgi:hypothetical protein
MNKKSSFVFNFPQNELFSVADLLPCCIGLDFLTEPGNTLVERNELVVGDAA